MFCWTFYPVFLGTIVSIIGLTRIAVQNYSATSPKTLSELAAAEQILLKRFRNILLFCGMLFAITLFGFIVPHIDYAPLVAFFGVLMIGGELLAAVLPARGKTSLAHVLLAQVMGIGMLGLGVVFALALTAVFAILAMLLAIGMVVFALLTGVDKKRYIAYELAFIFLSHFSVVLAAVAVR